MFAGKPKQRLRVPEQAFTLTLLLCWGKMSNHGA